MINIKKYSSLLLLSFFTSTIQNKMVYAKAPAEQVKPWGVYVGIDESTDNVSPYGDGQTQVFIPVKKIEGGIYFVDLRTFNSGNHSNNFNIGFGHRKILKKNLIGGINFSTGKRESNTGHTLKQNSIGVELLGKDIKFNSNYYFSDGKKSHSYKLSHTYVAELDGQGGAQFNHTVHTLKEAQGEGLDLQLRYDIPESVGDFNFSVGGLYYDYEFGNSQDFSDRNGYILNTIITKEWMAANHAMSGSFELGFADDSEYGDEFYFSGTFKFQFDKGSNHSNSIFSDDLYRMPERASEIVNSSVVKARNYSNAGTFHVGHNSHSQYSMVNGDEDVKDHIENAGEGSLVVFDGSQGDFLVEQLANATVNQSFVGGTTVVKVTGPNGEEAYLALPGETARIIYTPGADIVRNNTNVTGPNIDEVYLENHNDYGANLVQNFSFEKCHGLTGKSWNVYESLCGWEVNRSLSDAPIEIQNGGVTTDAYHGQAYLELDSHPKNGFTQSNADVFQLLDTKQGKVYRLTYFYQARVVGHESTNNVEVKWEGETVVTNNDVQRGWQQTVIYVRGNNVDANGGFSKLGFIGTGEEDTLGGFIDLVTVQEVELD